MSVAPLLKRFVEDELTRSADLISRTCNATLEQLRQPRDNLLTSSERQHYFELVQVLQQHQAAYQGAFTAALRRLVFAELDPKAGTLPAAALATTGPGGLQLMDEKRVESDIEISRAIQQIDTAAEWELRELQTFTSTLRGQAHVTAESNPLRPQSYARALWEAGASLPAVPPQQVILLRVSATVMAPFLRTAFAAASSRLEAQGVEPGIYRTVVIAPGAGRDAPPEMDVTRPGALDGLMRSMPAGSAPATPTQPDARRRGLPTTTPELEQALLRVEELLRRMPAPAPGDAAPASTTTPQLAEHRAALMATTGEMVDRQIIELLSRLFETILSDGTLPAGLHGAVARLQVSALRIALLDPSMLDAYDHPVWQLLDRIVTAATTYPHADDPRLVALQEFCNALVQQMAADPTQDSALYRRSLGRLDSFLAEQLRRQQREAQPAVDTLMRAEQSEQLQRTLATRLTEQVATLELSPLLRRFVIATWSHVLTASVQRFGDQGPETAAYLKVVDELLWSLRLPDHPQSRQRLLGMLPTLLQRLRDGMALIELPGAERQAVLDELMQVHSKALRPGAKPAATAADGELSPQEIVRRMREEVVLPPEPDPLDQSPFSDSLIDLASMETVPAELMNDEPGQATGDPRDWVKRMVPGDRYRLFLQGTWARVQLLWRSEHGHFSLFAGETPGQTHSVSLRALERLRAEKLLGALHEHSLIQRAVDAMLRDLARGR